MSVDSTLVLSLTIYKVVSVLAGLAFAYMGYKLFVHGIFEEGGELHATWSSRSLLFKKAAPGTFFALFGTVIVCVSLWRGLTIGPGGSGGSLDGSGMFSKQTTDGNDQNRQTLNNKRTPDTVLRDVATLNQFSADLLRQRKEAEGEHLTVAVQNSEQVLDLLERAKASLMLSAWSQDWGDRHEFQKWASGAPGYAYSDPPTSISRAAAIFKGDGP